jgi:hypothetical protein
MAIQLKDKVNVTAPGGAYPFGDVKDDSGANDGTPYDRATNSDYFQFFAKMLFESGITPNDLIENDTNGFQYFDALLKAVNLNPSSGVIETGSSVTIKTKVIEIGDWNMDATEQLTVLHGLDETKIRGVVDVVIRHDTTLNTDSLKYYPDFEYSQSDGNYTLVQNTGYIVLQRRTGGHFDSASYDATSFNRGWITFLYEA